MGQGYLQIILTLVIVVIMTPFLGSYMAKVFLGEKTFLDRWLNPIENTLYQWIQVRPQQAMTGWQYIRAILYSNLVMGILVLGILLFQNYLPFNNTQLPALNWDLALHTTISFLTNTDQQHYSGETTLSYTSQVLAIGFLMFTSAATGLVVGIAFIRGLTVDHWETFIKI